MNRKEKRDKKKEINILREVINVINQYFPELINNFEALTDLRNQSYVTYKSIFNTPKDSASSILSKLVHRKITNF